jgi:hypothetical protein
MIPPACMEDEWRSAGLRHGPSGLGSCEGAVPGGRSAGGFLERALTLSGIVESMRDWE